jgi:murein DD-endopeptidase MepM/ murein hydrolase activator NlpD
MATIDSKKLLPPSKKSGAIEKPKFLVPLKNISTKKITGSDLKPVDKETTQKDDVVVIRNKVIKIKDLIKNNYLLGKKKDERQRKSKEKDKFQEKESRLESKLKGGDKFTSGIIPVVPGGNILDRVNRFIGFTLLGYIFNNYAKYLPKLVKLGAKLAPALRFFESFAKIALDGTIGFIDLGYKAYDSIKKSVKDIGGKNYEKLFTDFSSNLNTALNIALIAAGGVVARNTKSLGGTGAGTSAAAKAALTGYKGRTPSQILKEGAKTVIQKKTVAAKSVVKPLVKVSPELEGVRTLVGVGGKGPGRSAPLSSREKKSAEGILRTIYGEKKGIPKAQVKPPVSVTPGKGVVGGGLGFIKGSLKMISIPVVSALVDYIISTKVLGEKPNRAAASAIGSGIGSVLGTAATAALGLGTGGIGAALLGGAIIGGASYAGSFIGTSLYDMVNVNKKSKFAQGGQVSGRGKKPSRAIKKTISKRPQKIQPQKTEPGKNIGGKLKIEELYGKDEPGKRSALRALKRSSEDVKGMRSLNGLSGAMFGAGIDMALGQKPDKRLATSLGSMFGSVVQTAIDSELNTSFNDISRTLAMANGGVIPSRRIGSGLSIGERIGKFISNALAVSIEGSATRILQNLNRELNLEGGPSGGNGGFPPGEVPAAEISEDQRKASSDLIKYFEKLYGKNAAIGIVANLLRESGLRTRTPDNSSFEGMAQWSRNDRWPKFVAWAQSKGKDPYSRSAQAEWIAIELKQSGTDARLKKAESADAAASIFYNEFERAAYSKPILGSKYNPDNPHERKNRSFVASLMGGAGAPSAMVEGGIKPTDIPLTSGQGWRWGKMHKGVDLDGGDGSPISSAQDAKVVWAGDKGDGYGNSVILRYSNGAETRFAHLKSFNVSTGGTIKAGQMIGRQGNTGSSTASHLHFEYYPNGGAMTYEGYGRAESVMNSYFRYGGNVVAKPTSKPADIFSINKKDNKKRDNNKPSSLFNWNQSSVAPTQSSTVAALNSGILNTPTDGLIIEKTHFVLQKEIQSVMA